MRVGDIEEVACRNKLEAVRARIEAGCRHNREYHDWALNEIDDAIENTPGNNANKQAAVKKRLQDIGKFLSKKDKSGKFKNASFLYNTVQAKKTKFAGKQKRLSGYRRCGLPLGLPQAAPVAGSFVRCHGTARRQRLPSLSEDHQLERTRNSSVARKDY